MLIKTHFDNVIQSIKTTPTDNIGVIIKHFNIIDSTLNHIKIKYDESAKHNFLTLQTIYANMYNFSQQYMFNHLDYIYCNLSLQWSDKNLLQIIHKLNNKLRDGIIDLSPSVYNNFF